MLPGPEVSPGPEAMLVPWPVLAREMAVVPERMPDRGAGLDPDGGPGHAAPLRNPPIRPGGPRMTC